MKYGAVFNDNIVVFKVISFIFPFFFFLVLLSSLDVGSFISVYSVLDRSFYLIKFVLPNLSMQLCHRQMVIAVTFFFNNINYKEHLHSALPVKFQPTRGARHSLQFKERRAL